ncbi:MAG TPA: hypothetical protein VFD30_04455 [Terriglobia bacterium]|nr:hypothetical protein [Terriglobia bacterium]
MRRATYFLFVFLVASSVALPDDGPGLLTPQGPGPVDPSPLTKDAKDGSNDDAEEPDYAFIAGGPYTQKKNSLQLIFAGQGGRRQTNLGGSTLEHAEFGTYLRAEWGLTDRWEIDVIVPAEGARDRLNDVTVKSDFAASDSVLGIRYRLLTEPSAPFTMTMGPQVILPSGDFSRGTGFERPGYAWDWAAAKDWGGPVFLYASWNYALFPKVRTPGTASRRGLNLQNLFGGTALGYRALEKDRGQFHHDIHVFFEYGISWEQDLTRDSGVTSKVTDVHSLVAPGIRYGLLTARQTLVEIGVSFPIGLDRGTPRYGVILQFQFERGFGLKGSRRE